MNKVMARIEKWQIKGNDGKEVDYIELICGGCGNMLYGFDEDICPSCGALNDFSKCPNTLGAV